MIIVDSALVPPQATRRPKLRERRLVTPLDSEEQNIILIDAEVGADVELHPVPNSEALFILSGEYEALAEGQSRRIGPGTLIYFSPGEVHGFRCIAGPGQYLVIFAPARSR